MLSKILQISENIWKKSVSVSADIIYMISFTEDYRKNETEILKSYIEEAPRDYF